MSQKLQFWKIKIFTEEVTQDFSPESLHKALESLLRGTEIHSSEYVEKYFDNLPLNYLQINDPQLEKITPNYSKNLDYTLFDPQRIIFFMMDQQIWGGIQKIVEVSIKQIIDEEKPDLANKLKRISAIGKDYDHLSNLYEQKKLFVSIS